MSTYVMSDLHGQYQAFLAMLDQIQFSDEDVLYIVGDVLDRGPNPIKIILDLMERPNVILLAGNHELMALDCLQFLMQEITEENIENFTDEVLERLANWSQNGSATTMSEFRKLDHELQQEVIDYLYDSLAFEELEIGNRSYILVHSGFRNFDPNRDFYDYPIDDLVWARPDYQKPYFQNRFCISGHTPTMFIPGNPKPGYIYHNNTHIAIDCGCSVPGGRLGCIRLEDLDEYYVELDVK